MAGDIQYLMQAFTGIEDRLSNIEASAGDQGIDPKISLCSEILYILVNDRDEDSLNLDPLNEQGEPVLNSYNSDPNNFQMNMILGKL